MVEHDEHSSTRVSRAWLAAAVGLILLLFAAIFIAQNGDDVRLQFLAWEWDVALGVGLLLSAVAGGLAVLFLGAARMVQLKRDFSRHRRADAEREAQRDTEAGDGQAGEAEHTDRGDRAEQADRERQPDSPA